DEPDERDAPDAHGEFMSESHEVMAELHHQIAHLHTRMKGHYQGAHEADTDTDADLRADEEREHTFQQDEDEPVRDLEKLKTPREVVHEGLARHRHYGDPSSAGFYLRRARVR